MPVLQRRYHGLQIQALALYIGRVEEAMSSLETGTGGAFASETFEWFAGFFDDALAGARITASRLAGEIVALDQNRARRLERFSILYENARDILAADGVEETLKDLAASCRAIGGGLWVTTDRHRRLEEVLRRISEWVRRTEYASTARRVM